MDTLFRIFVLKEIHGWNHETALVEYLDNHLNFASSSSLRPFRTSQHCGEAGTSASPPSFGKQSRLPHKRFLLLFRTKLSLFHVIRSGSPHSERMNPGNPIPTTGSSWNGRNR
jgi:hypothetical protein